VLLIGLVVGLAIGILALGARRTPAPESSAGFQVDPPISIDAVPSAEPGVGELIPDFPDGVVAVAIDFVEGAEFLNWPLNGSPWRLALPAAPVNAPPPDGQEWVFARIDTAGDFVALAMVVPQEDRLVLMAGRPRAILPVATGVTSFVWHRTEPGALALVVDRPDGRWLETMFQTPLRTDTIEPIAEGEEVKAWTDWGFVLEDDSHVSLLVDSQRRSLPGTFIGASSTGVLIGNGAGVDVYDITTGELAPYKAVPASTTGVVFAPNGTKGAAIVQTGVQVFDEGGEIHRWDVRPSTVAWSSDSRFVVAVSSREVVVLDTSTGEMYVLDTGPVATAAVRSVR
jgi:hypothetical protein